MILQRLATNAISRAPKLSLHLLVSSRRFYTKYIIKENDVVLLKKKSDSRAEPFLSKPLRPATTVKATHGSIPAEHILGKTWRDVISQTWKGKETQYRIYQPSLADYVTLFPRKVTPIYPADANLIVSLLDLHPSTPSGVDTEDRLEIFEAGTGHGALTLHLARAIHAANTPAPPIPPPVRFEPGTPAVTENDIDSVAPPKSVEELEAEKTDSTQEAYDVWRSKRRAVIHTLDNSASHSGHAQKVVRNFRRGLYYPHIDFHVGQITDYLSGRFADTGNDEPFLEHAILDLPGTHNYMEIVGKALKPNGPLITFSPSLTQIMTCVNVVKDQRLPFLLESVLELGAGVGVGGREWDVRAVKPRALLKAEAAAREQTEGNVESSAEEAGPEDVAETPTDSARGWEMVCRPKVGIRISGGGFVGLWRRMEQY